MFDNILHQPVIARLKADIASGSLAPALLFSGPRYGGKGTAALELARVLDCEAPAPGAWNCGCPGCIRHRNLVSSDLLLLGRRRFYEETSASSEAFLRNPENAGGRMLFIRSVRKLLARFNPVLWEEDPKLGKIRSLAGALEEDLSDFEESPVPRERSAVEKHCKSIIEKAVKLETGGLGEYVPVSQIRRAAYWSRLAPLGRHKCIVIENAEQMQEGAKNSLLKILEEPPPRVTIVLTSSRSASLLPTVLSRLRDYRFVKRGGKEEGEVIARIFRETDSFQSIEAYLESFLPVGGEILYPLGAYFVASAAAEAVRELRNQRRDIPPLLADLGSFAAPIAESAGMGRPAPDLGTAAGKTLQTAERFEIPGLLSRFLLQISSLISAWLRSGGSPEKTVWSDLWRRELQRAAAEADSFNIAAPMVLERLLEALKTGMIT
ncbi:MAG: DNA polymerase III [Spirochaetaceae bacterium]|nr:DNA polymerase III [Spirochaetaceae bacterium]